MTSSNLLFNTLTAGTTRLANRASLAEMAVAERAVFSAARAVLAGGGAAATQRWRRCLYREVAVRAALAAMVDFEL